MPILEDLKVCAERATGLRRPSKGEAPDFARVRKPHAVSFKNNGLVPNHPRWPLIIYRGAVALDERQDPAAMIEDLFEASGRGATCRDGIYDYVHYHSRIHEVLGIARGKGRVRFGGRIDFDPVAGREQDEFGVRCVGPQRVESAPAPLALER